MINTDKNPVYGEALRQLKRNDPNVETIGHRTAKYLNNRIEADHDPIKRLCRATLGFKSMKMAYATIKGFEVMRNDPETPVHPLGARRHRRSTFVNKLFDLPPNPRCIRRQILSDRR